MRSLILLPGCLALLASAGGRAEGPPRSTAEWRMFRGDAFLRGVARVEGLSAKPRLRWTFTAPGPVQSTAAIVNGKVIVATLDGTLHCLELDPGEEARVVWEAKIEAGFAASPLVHGGRIFLGDDMGAFRAFSAKDGKELWKYETDAEIQSSATMDATGERIVFGSYDGRLHCVDRDGNALWTLETDGQIHSTPAIVAGKTFVSGCDEQFRVVDVATGKEVSSVAMGGYTASSPAVVGDRAYVATFGAQVLAIDWSVPKIVWTYENPKRQFPYYASCAVTESRVVAAGRDKAVHALDRTTGKAVWTFPTRGRVDSSPVVINDRALVVGSSDGTLYMLDLADGSERWSFIGGAPFTASPAVAGGRLVIGDEDGRVRCFLLVEP